jgi:clathrin heavy chain
LTRGSEFAEKINTPQVWSLLGNAYINHNHVNPALDCFLKAQDASTFGQVIGLAEYSADRVKFINYLLMARQNMKDSLIDNALFYAFAVDNKLTELEELLKNPNSADL